MNKSEQKVEGLSKQKPLDQYETKPDMKGDKVWYSDANKTRNNKPEQNK